MCTDWSRTRSKQINHLALMTLDGHTAQDSFNLCLPVVPGYLLLVSPFTLRTVLVWMIDCVVTPFMTIESSGLQNTYD